MANTWDPANKGPDVVLTSGNLNANSTGLQEFVRATLGYDPATLTTPRQFEITVPGGSGPNNVRPMFGLVQAPVNCSVTLSPVGSTANAYAFLANASGGAQGSTIWNNGNTNEGWGVSTIGGTAFVAGLIYDGPNKRLKICVDGVLKYTLDSNSSYPVVVGANGTLIYPAFGSGSAADPGVQNENGLLNLGASPFAFPFAGAIPWTSPLSSPSQMMMGSL